MRKWFYLFTCEYCFSHYVVGGGGGDYRLSTCCCPAGAACGVAWLSCVWVANIYMSLFGRLRLDIKRERVEISAVENPRKRA